MNKLLKITLTSLIVLVLSAVVAFVVLINAKSDPLDDLVKYSYQTPEITTDLKDGSFVRIQFQVETDGKKAFKEISKREFQLKNVLIKELAQLNEEKFTTKLTELEEIVKDELNELMTEGEILNVYTTSKILQ